MDPETRKFLLNRKIGDMLPWIGIVGMVILTFSPIFGGFPLFFTELGFVANFYFFIDEYNWLAQRLLINKDHTLNHDNEVKVKQLLFITLILAIICAIILGFLRAQSFYNFVVGISFIASIYFIKHDIEYGLIIFRLKLEEKRYYSILIGGTVIGSIILLISYFFINWLVALCGLAAVGCIYVFERDVMKEMKKCGIEIDWDDDDDSGRFSVGN